MDTRQELEEKLKSREDAQLQLFDVSPSWKNEWWGMPDFDNQDASPHSQITVNFQTAADREDFARRLGVVMGPQTNTLWHPPKKRLANFEFYWDGPPTDSKYPVCIPSKGRAGSQTTGDVLLGLGVSHRFFVEETEAEEYAKRVGEDRVVVLPFHDLGQGSIPARNFIWEWCREREHDRHWVLDDNIRSFARTHLTRRLTVFGGAFFQAMEDFVDRYENIAMAGPHHTGFVKVGWSDVPAYYLNTRVYSCILLDTKLPHRWRGRYNEDTDLSLRLLKDGYCTCIFAALLMDKRETVGASNPGVVMPGGNTDNVYKSDDHRRSFAESLRDQHPDVVKVVWKFGRWHHQVDYSGFRGNRLRLKPGIVPTVGPNDYGMRLVRKAPA